MIAALRRLLCQGLTVGWLYKYTYDAENRVTEMMPNKDQVQMKTGDKKYVHAYDYLGRRVRTRVYAWDCELNGGQGGWSAAPLRDQRFMYHGRQRILTLDGSGADDELFKFVWGPDPMKGGGRLGQLLAVGDDPNSVDYIAFHDGAGNLGQIAKRSDGSLVAKYDFNGRVRADVIGECEDPDALDDCDQCGPCFFGYGVSGNWFYLICGCGPSHDDPGTGCVGDDCGWGPDLDPGGWGAIGGPWYYELVPGDEYPDPGCPGAPCTPVCPYDQCRELCRKSGTLAETACYDGRPCICICGGNIDRRYPRTYLVLGLCIRNHEMVHVRDAASREVGSPGGCECEEGPCHTRRPAEGDDPECRAQIEGIQCVYERAMDCYKYNDTKRDRCKCIWQLKRYVKSRTCRAHKEGSSCPPAEQERCEKIRDSVAAQLHQDWRVCQEMSQKEHERY